MRQSERHPDGWGVAYYVAKSPHLIKSSATAFEDKLFERVSGVVSAETILAHLRRATVGAKSVINSQPFQYGKWVFAHNGTIRNFDSAREALLLKVKPELRKFILGDTDSEVFFFLILTQLAERVRLEGENAPLKLMVEAARMALAEIVAEVGEMEQEEEHAMGNALTFVLTDGQSMLAHNGGRNIQLSTYKKRCVERDSCPKFAHQCENPSREGHVSHFIVSSEPLLNDNVWELLPFKEMCGVDSLMKVWYSSAATNSDSTAVKQGKLAVVAQ